MHFNFTDLYYQNSYRIIVYILQRIVHIISQNCWYFMQINLWWWAIPKIRVYLISRFYSNRENLMHAKYTFLYSSSVMLQQRPPLVVKTSKLGQVSVLQFLTVEFIVTDKWTFI